MSSSLPVFSACVLTDNSRSYTLQALMTPQMENPSFHAGSVTGLPAAGGVRLTNRSATENPVPLKQ
jgi:hypothetical protein